MDYKSLAREFMEIMHKMRKRKAQKQVSDSMHGEHFVLFYISRHEGNVIPSDISNEMGISSARIAAALNGLEGKGYIVRLSRSEVFIQFQTKRRGSTTGYAIKAVVALHCN